MKLSNGTVVELKEENGWEAKVENLPKIDSATGNEIEYTWEEVDLPEGYTLTETTKNGTVTTLTNSHDVELIDIEVEKVWKDNDNKDKARPRSVTIILLANGTEVGSKILDESNGWTETFTDLYRYENGTEIKY